MEKANFRRTLVGAAVAAALSVGPADAGQWKGIFDPVDFEGEYIVEVDQACIDQGTGWYANDGICSATLKSAFADVVSSSPDPTYVGQLNFAPPDISDPFTLLGLYVSYGTIESLDSTLIAHNGASPSTTDNWWMQFVSGHMPPPDECYSYCPAAFLGPAAVFDTSLKGVYLYANSTDAPVASAEYIGRAVLLAPEPGTLSLLLGALGGGWLARRRRKERVPDPN